VIDVSVVVPAYNEAQNLPNLVGAVRDVLDSLGVGFEIVLVNDGSTDGTEQVLLDLQTSDRAVVPVNLARNFGKEPALAAGLATAKGRCLIFMDADLQHPPAVIRFLYQGWREGFDVVNAVKRQRSNESLVHHAFAYLFNRIMTETIGRDMAGASDFKLIDRQVVDVLLGCQERNRFFRGLVAWVGFKVKSIEFDVPDREHGKSKWSLGSLASYFLNNVVAFSSLPLRLVAYAGFALATLGLALLLQTLYHYWSGTAAIGFTTVIALQILVGGMILAALGVIAIYLSKMYDEQKQRPLFIVRAPRSIERLEQARDRNPSTPE
jgi:dolichol-phosphate mannosyltransferase